jgi:hypothetical protein
VSARLSGPPAGGRGGRVDCACFRLLPVALLLLAAKQSYPTFSSAHNAPPEAHLLASVR